MQESESFAHGGSAADFFGSELGHFGPVEAQPTDRVVVGDGYFDQVTVIAAGKVTVILAR